MYWIYISNVAYQGQVYAGRLTKIIAMWTVYGVNGRACACVCVYLKIHVQLGETIVWAIFLSSVFSWCFLMCFPAYSQHLSTSVDIFLNTVADMLRGHF